MVMSLYVYVSMDCLKQLSQILVLIKTKTGCQHSLNTRGYIVVNKTKNDDRRIWVYNIVACITSININRIKSRCAFSA